jgi:hypothetical protein
MVWFYITSRSVKFSPRILRVLRRAVGRGGIAVPETASARMQASPTLRGRCDKAGGRSRPTHPRKSIFGRTISGENINEINTEDARVRLGPVETPRWIARLADITATSA